jgi:hypothetical protein
MDSSRIEHLPEAASVHAERSSDSPDGSRTIHKADVPRITADASNPAAEVGTTNMAVATSAEHIRRWQDEAAASAGRPPPLTMDDLERLAPAAECNRGTGHRDLSSELKFARRQLGLLGFSAHRYASVEGRIEYINAVADWLAAIPGEDPLPVLSIGAGEMLTEHLIHGQLPPSVQARIRWLLVEPDPQAEHAMTEFALGKGDARLFPSEAAYFAARSGGQRQADLDLVGHPMILLPDPAVVAARSDSLPPPEGSRCLVGRAVDAKNANTIVMKFEAKTPPVDEGPVRGFVSRFLPIGAGPKPSAEEEALSGFARQLAGGWGAASRTVIECRLGDDGTPQFEVAAGVDAELAARVAERVTGFLNALPPSLASPMEKLNAAVNSAALELNASDDVAYRATSIPFASYGTTVDRLLAHFAKAKIPCVWARFQDNETTIGRVPLESARKT